MGELDERWERAYGRFRTSICGTWCCVGCVGCVSIQDGGDVLANVKLMLDSIWMNACFEVALVWVRNHDSTESEGDGWFSAECGSCGRSGGVNIAIYVAESPYITLAPRSVSSAIWQRRIVDGAGAVRCGCGAPTSTRSPTSTSPTQSRTRAPTHHRALLAHRPKPTNHANYAVTPAHSSAGPQEGARFQDQACTVRALLRRACRRRGKSAPRGGLGKQARGAPSTPGYATRSFASWALCEAWHANYHHSRHFRAHGSKCAPVPVISA